MLDLIIIGGSAAGCGAAIYAARRKLNFKIVTDGVGGEVALSGEINNWLGEKSVQGFDLAQKFMEHVKSYNVAIDDGFTAQKITPKKKHYAVEAKNYNGDLKTYETKTVIIATGIHPRRLGVPGENKYFHKGVTYCTVCDGPLFKDKTTVTVGSGNSALESAMMMNSIAKKVYLLSKFPNDKENNWGFPKGENILIDKVKQMPQVEIIYEAKTTEILGNGRVEGLKYTDAKGKAKQLKVDGVMAHIGTTPNSQFADKVAKDKMGQIVVDEKCRTNLPGVYAAGDVTNVAFKQIGIAVGQGITATLAAIEYLNRWKE
ncbi:MAG: FAD-dependent oxidoreductase [Patescibacteria group bacterium]